MTTLTNQARSSSEADVLAINTIRTLAMDAVQAANSGHPGTPMALAPVAYTLWQRFLRFDPQDPIWPNRDRFVLSAGHASMLLYSLLHLTGVKAVNPEYETLGEPVGAARRHQEVPPARQQVPRPPRVPLDLAASRPPPARSARAWPPASAWPSRRSGMAAHFNRPGFDAVRLRRLRPLRRRRHDGGHLGRGRLARRAPQALQPLLDLRQQPASPSRATPTWPSARTWPRGSSATAGTSRASATPTTSRCSRGRSTTFQETTDRPTLIIVDSHIGYGVAEQAGHQRRPRRAAGRGGDPA